VVEESRERLLLEEEHGFEPVALVPERHGPFYTNLFLSPHNAGHLGVRIVKADLLIVSDETHCIATSVLHLHVVALETQRKVIAASKLESFVCRFQEELADRWMV